MSRGTKQFFVAFVYVLIASILGVMVYYAFIKAPETCFDNKQNQNEQGIDCGGVCALACKEVVTGDPIELKESRFIRSGEGKYDILGKIFNPNSEAGAISFTYVANLLDSTSNVVATRSGIGYILPLESKYILEFNLETPTVPISVSLQITNVEWARFSGYQDKPALDITQRQYNELSSSSAFGEAKGLVTNSSPYDFRSVVVQVILRDGIGIPLAINSTVMNTLRSHENRDFRLVWPSSFPGSVENVEMVVDADIYHSENFVQQYTPGTTSRGLTPSK